MVKSKILSEYKDYVTLKNYRRQPLHKPAERWSRTESL